MKYLTLIVFILFSGILAAQDGKALYDKNCKACHKIGGGKLVGPDLAGITKKRSVDWLSKFIMSSANMIAAGDKEAIKVFEEFAKMPMPSHTFAPAELNALLSYLNNPVGGAGAEQGSEVPQLFTPNADLGRDLFTGKTRLVNGGASCISCHSVKDEKVFFGGTLAKDLSTSYNVGIVGTMATSMPAMISAYKTHELALSEKAHLELFLKTVKENQLFTHSRQLQSLVFLGGIVFFFVLVLVSGFFWKQTKKVSVKDEIFKRQKKVLQQ
ncbi:MAG: hypothetical protein A2X86_02935 [Bdellovibrionales bacterium GWA2_49_15]|nr:MAG: hypothetical protein A2X86_02935 [Bdellovibrionales bacterium GWA2_49_15]HAZ14105.1 hypothetical protein [Bdellovibrionales bacterium]